MRFTREQAFLLGLGGIAAGAAYDLWSDLGGGAGQGHLVEEALVLGAALGLFAWMAWEIRRRGEAVAGLRRELAEAAAVARTAGAADQALRRQLGEFIAAQFAAWQLSPSEREIGWLLLKGLSLKEIAGLRETAEKTVRQQASAIYRKAGVNGRPAFAAWFIEDYL
ncbi:MAG: response regulator transcription factor [Gammaproteobacteria bacterium]|nr:response regulator transcription factor [Gammaproteobacteria bacterium]MCP5198757.1 response regulator transcription factor [Gammaproteobacteria bacterium]